MRIKYRLFTLALPLVMLFACVPNYNFYGIKGVSANKMTDNSYKIEINENNGKIEPPARSFRASKTV